MLYSRRWLYVFCCVIAVIGMGYFADLQQLLEQYSDIVRAGNKLQSSVNRPSPKISHAVSSNESMISQSKYLPALFELLQRNHVDLIAVSRVGQIDPVSSQMEEYQIILNGEYENLYRVFAGFASQSDEYMVKSIVLQPSVGQHLQAELTLNLRDRTLRHIAAHDETQHIVNPFCGSHALQNDIENQAFHFSLHEMQLLGVVLHGQQSSAIIRFADGVINAFGVGAPLGKEGGHIEKINDSSVTVLLPNQSRIVL